MPDEIIESGPIGDLSPETTETPTETAPVMEASPEATESTVEAPVETQDAQSDIDDDVLYLAERAGFNKDQAKAFKSRSDLVAALRVAEMMKPRSEPAQPEQKTVQEKLDLSFKIPDKLRESLDPDFLSALDAHTAGVSTVLEQMQQRVAQAESRYEELRTSERSRQANEFRQFADGFFTSGENADVFGTHPAEECAAKEPLRFQNRMRVLEAFDAITTNPALYKTVGGDRESAMRAAYRIAFPEHAEKTIQRTVANKVVARSKQIIAKPTSAVTPESKEKLTGLAADLARIHGEE